MIEHAALMVVVRIVKAIDCIRSKSKNKKQTAKMAASPPHMPKWHTKIIP
jgi:hypothetical protein